MDKYEEVKMNKEIKPLVIKTADIYLHFPFITRDEADCLDEFLEEEYIEYEGATDVFEQLQKENEKLHHYKTLYQSLKRQKEELRDYLTKEISDGRSEDNLWLMGVYDEDKNILQKLEELEALERVSNE